MTTINITINIIFILVYIFVARYVIRCYNQDSQPHDISLMFKEWYRTEKHYIRIKQQLQQMTAISTSETDTAVTHNIDPKTSITIQRTPPKPPRKRGKKKGSPGGGLKKPHVAEEELRVVRIAPKDAPLGVKLAYDHSHYVVDLNVSKGNHIKTVITRYDVYRYWDPSKKQIMRPVTPEDRLRYGVRYRAFVLTLYFYCNMTIESIAQFLEEFFRPYNCSKQAILAWIREAATILKPFYNSLKQLIKLAQSAGVDETSARISGTRKWVWILTTGFLVIYHLDEHRSREVALRLLDGFTGLVTSDFFKAYDKLNVRQQKCLTHLMRRIAKEISQIAKEILKNQEKLKKQKECDKEGKRRKRGRPRKTRVMTGEEIASLHDKINEKYEALAVGLKLIALISEITKREYKYEDAARRLEEMIIELGRYDEYRKIKKLLKKYLRALVEFLRYPEDINRKAWTNNDAERSVKAFARFRRKQSFRSVDTVGSIVIILSVIESYRRLVGEFSYEMWVRIRYGDFSDMKQLEEVIMERYAK